MSLLITNARVFPGPAGRQPQPGVDVRVEGERIVDMGTALPFPAADARIDAAGRVLLPGFVDAHTHALWAGDRLDEFDQKQRGASYLDILKAGGGIMSTVRAVRAQSEAKLAEFLHSRVARMLDEGTTTIEVKSGYGLRTEDELKMLRVIHSVDRDFAGTLVATALLGHALDSEQPNFVQRVIEETLPAVHAEFPTIAIDAYCEQGAWSVKDCKRLFERALALGHPVRVHVDQFHALGMLEVALRLGARSVDHLEATSARDLRALAASPCYGVMLPVSGFHTDGRYGDARALLDAGGRLVLASNCNPGSSPSSSMPLVVSLATRLLAIHASEAITACTHTPARLLQLEDRGQIAVGKRADLVLLKHRDERMLGYELGGDPVDLVICAGRIVRERLTS